MSEEPQYLTRLASEIDEALERSDEIAELQDTRVLAAAYRAEKARAERAEQVLATEHDLWVQAEAERDAAAESCRLMQDRVERLVEANLGLQARLDDDEWRKVYEIEKANAERLFKSNLGLRETLESIASDTNYWDATNRARAALGKEGGG